MNPGGSDSLPLETEKRLEALADEYLERLELGEALEPEEFARQHGELAGRLLPRLLLVQQIVEVAFDSAVDEPETASLACPVCKSSVVVAPGAGDRVTCPSCQGEFSLAVDPDAADWQGDRLDRFEILGTLGQGSFGHVYRARDTELGREVTLKVPRRSSFVTPADEARFSREARAVAELRHPGIVRVLEVTEVDGLPVIVREYIEGQPLDELLAEKCLEVRQAAVLIRQIAEALGHAHRRGIVHRDVKPANIIIDAEGQPHLTDFGLAKHTESEDVTMTLEGQVLGTPAYMSPEQARGKQDLIGPHSDQFSLGVIFYELLTGERPFTGSRSMILEQVVERDPRSLRHLDARIPRDLETICLRAMAREIPRRYAGVEDLASDLGRFLEGRPIEARAVSSLERIWLWCRRRPLVAGLLTSVLILLATVTAGAVFKARNESQLRQEAEVQVARLHTRAGIEYFESREYFQALPHLVESLTLSESRGQSENESIQRLRLGTLLLHSPRLLHLWSLEAPPRDFDFSPDGRHLALALPGGRVVVHAIPSGEPIGEPLEHPGELRSVRFHPSRPWLLTSATDDRVRVWAWVPGEPIQEPLEPGIPTGYALFSPDGTRILVAASGGKVFIGQPGSPEPIATIHHPRGVNILKAYYFQDSRRVATLGTDDRVRIWWADSAELLLTLPHVPAASDLALHPDGESLVVVSRHRHVQRYDARSGKPLGPPMRSGYGPTSASFNADGDRIVVTGWGIEGQVFDTRSGQPTARLAQGFDHQVAEVSPDGQRVAFVGSDRRVRIWDIDTGQRETPFLSRGHHVTSVGFHPDGHMLLTVGGEGLLALWDLSRRQPSRPSGRHDSWVTDLCPVDGGQSIVSISKSGKTKVWEVDTARFLTSGPRHPGGMPALEVHPDRTLAASVGGDEWARIWRISDGRVLHFIRLRSAGRCVAFSPDGQVVAFTEERGFVRIFTVETGVEVVDPLPTARMPRALDFSQDGNYLATGGAGNLVHVYEVASGKPVGPAFDVGIYTFSLALGREARILVLVNPARARVVDPRTGETRVELGSGFGGCRVIRLSPDERHVLMADVTGYARVFDVETGQPVGRPMVRSSGYFSGIFSDDGNLVALGSAGGLASIHDALTGDPVVPALEHDDRISCLQFTREDSLLVTGSHDGMVKSWDLASVRHPAGDLRWLARALTGSQVDPERGDLEPLEREEMEVAWREARERLPAEFELDPGGILSWHRSEIIRAIRQGRSATELFHNDCLIRRESWSWRHYNKRGAAHLRAGNILTSIPDGFRAVSLLTLDILGRATFGVRFPADSINEFWQRSGTVRLLRSLF